MTTRHPGGRPPLPPEARAVRLNITLEPETLADLDALAETDGIPRSHEIAALVRKEKKRRKALARSG